MLDYPDMITRVIDDLVTDEVSPEWFGKWPQVKRHATSLWSFQPCVLPGLFQTPEYAGAVLNAAHLDIDLEEALTTRLDRQTVLIKEDPPMFVSLIAEGVLRHRVGSDKVMYDQLMHLIDVTRARERHRPSRPGQLRRVRRIQWRIRHRECSTATRSAMSTTSSPGIDRKRFGVARLRRFFDIFRAGALNQQDSIDLIRRVAEEWK